MEDQHRRVSRATQPSCSTLLLLDFQVGVGDQLYSKTAAQQAAATLATARNVGLLVIFSKLEFQDNYSDISPRNCFFIKYKTENKLPPGASRLIPAFTPLPNEILINKPRFSAFSGRDLGSFSLARNHSPSEIGGVSTGGVVLTTLCEAVDEDFELTILRDACADPNPDLNEQLASKLFPRSAAALTTDAWKGVLKP